MATFGQRLRNLRIQKGVNQTQMAEALKLSQATIATYETGTRFPQQKLLIKIANYLEVTPNELLVNNSEIFSVGGILTIPVYENLSHEVPLYNKKYIDSYTYIPDDGSYEYNKVFMFIATDNTMSSRISIGDKLLVKTDEDIQNGDLAVVHILKKPAIIRRFHKIKSSNQTIFSADNPCYPPQSVRPHQYKIRGKVTCIISRP